MATIYNSALTNNIVKATKASTNRDKIPSELAEKVLPVIDVNPRPNIVCDIIARNTFTNSTGGTVYTTPATKDFYLTNVTLSACKDATGTQTEFSCRVTVGGATQRIVEIKGITLNALNQTVTQHFNPPILIDRNTVITSSADTAVANCIHGVQLQGYTLEP